MYNKKNINAETRMKGQKWIVPLPTMFLGLIRQNWCLKSNTRVKFYKGKHLHEIGRIFAWGEFSHKNPVKDKEAVKHNTQDCKILVLNNELIYNSKLYMNVQWQLLRRTALQWKVQARAHFGEDDSISHYRQWSRSY